MNKISIFIFMCLVAFAAHSQPIPKKMQAWSYSIGGGGTLSSQQPAAGAGGMVSSCSNWTCSWVRTLPSAPVCVAQVNTNAGVWCNSSCSTSSCTHNCWNPGGGQGQYTMTAVCVGGQ